MYALKFVAYLLSKVPSKTIPKTYYELWIRRKPSLRHLHIWRFPTELRVYHPHEKKLDGRTINGFHISYPNKSKWYIFYYLNHNTKIVEYGNARFIKNCQINGSEESQKVNIQEKHVEYLHLMFLLNLLFLLLYHGHTTFQCNKSIFQTHKINIGIMNQPMMYKLLMRKPWMNHK